MSTPFADILSQQIRVDHPAVVDRRYQLAQDGDLENLLRSLNERIHSGDLNQAIRNVQLQIEELARNPKEVPSSAQTRKEEYESSLIGVGFIRFAGWMNAASVIHLERDLDTRVNPRPRDESHVEGIKESVQVKKEDFRYPIFIKVNPELIDATVRDTLRTTKPFQEYETLPPFLLNNISAREMQLSREVFWERSEEAPFGYLTREELNARIIERDQLRTSRERATLVNGSHRVDAMSDIATEFEPRRRAYIDLGKQLQADPENRQLLEDYSLAAAELALRMNDHTWQVIIFKDTTDPALLNELATNSDPLPTLPAGEGEKMWMFASQVEADMEQIMLIYPGISRSELFDRWRSLRRENSSEGEPEDDGPVPRAATPQLTDQELRRKSKKKQKDAIRDTLTGQAVTPKSSKGKGTTAGEYMYQRLTTVPVTFEMLLANKACIWPLTGLLSSSAVDTLLQPSSGAFVANLWLSMEILQQLANASGSEAFVRAQYEIPRVSVTARGSSRVQPIWKDMAQNPQRLPEALRLYNADIAKVFEAKYIAQFPAKLADDDNYLQRDYYSELIYLKARAVFEDFGIALEGHTNGAFRRMGTASRVYARLPGWDFTPFQHIQHAVPNTRYQDYFLSRATLPCSALALQWGRLANRLCGPGSGAAVEFVDYLMDRSKPLWVSGNTNKLKANWYNTNRGTHQAVALWVAEVEQPMGYIASRLVSCLSWLDYIRFYKGMRYIDKVVKSQHRISSLRVPYGAGRSKGLDSLLPAKLELDVFTSRLPAAQCGSSQDAVEALKAFARKPLKQFIQHGQPQDLSTLCATHPISALISPVFWQTSRPILYGTSWDVEDRNSKIPETLLGWGLTLDAYHHLVVTHLLLHRVVYFIVDFVDISCEEEKPWWGTAFKQRNLRRMRRSVLDATSEEVPSDDQSDSDDGELDYPNPKQFTGHEFVREHVTKPSLPPASIPTASANTTVLHTKSQGRNPGNKSGKARGTSMQASQRGQKGLRKRVANISETPPQTSHSKEPEEETPTQERLSEPLPTPEAESPTPPGGKAISESVPHPHHTTPPPPINSSASSQHGSGPRTRGESRSISSPRGSDQPANDHELEILDSDVPMSGGDDSKLSDDRLNASERSPTPQQTRSTPVAAPQDFDEAGPTHSAPFSKPQPLTTRTLPASPLQGRGINSVPLPPLARPQALQLDRSSPSHPPSPQSISGAQRILPQNTLERGNDILATLGERSPPPANRDDVSNAPTTSQSPKVQLRIEPPKGVILVAESQPSVTEPTIASLIWAAPDPHRSEPYEYQTIKFDTEANFAQVLKDNDLFTEGTQNEIVEDMVIPGILLSGFLSDRLLPGLEGQHSYQPIRDPRSMLESIETAEKRTCASFKEIYSIREATLRHMLLDMPKIVTGAIHPVSFILDNLAPLIYNHKLTYLKQVACIIHINEIPYDQAWAEAVLMASCDKVFKHQSFEWKPNGDLIFDVSWTFPAGTTNLDGGGQVWVANIERPGASFQRIWGAFTSYTPTAVSQGPTLAEAMGRAVTAAPIQAYQNYGYGNGLFATPDQSFPRPVFPVVDEVDWDQASAFDAVVYNKGKAPANPRVPSVGEVHYSRRPDAWSGKEHAVAQELGVQLRHPNDGPHTHQSRRSCFSDGDFCRKYPFIVVEAGEDSLERQLIPRMLDAKLKLEALRKEGNERLDDAYKKMHDRCAEKRLERVQGTCETDRGNVDPAEVVPSVNQAPSQNPMPSQANPGPTQAIRRSSRLSQRNDLATSSQIEWSSSLQALQDRSPPQAASPLPRPNQEANRGNKRRVPDEGIQPRKRVATGVCDEGDRGI